MIEKIGIDVLKKATPGIVKKAGGQVERTFHSLKAKVANACHSYEKNYRERHGQIKVFCVGMREPIPLDDVYVVVQFLDRKSASNYSSPRAIEHAFRERGKIYPHSSRNRRQDGIRIANDKQYFMLLGGPGVGKSTFLRKVGLEALKVKREHFEHKCIPVLLELKRFTENQIDIEALIAKEFEICGYPYPNEMVETALKSGNLLILFDGLDEVPTANVDNVVNKIGDFVDKYRQNRFIASCRIAAYTGGLTRFSEVEMADFDNFQIQSYINNWFASTPDRHRRQLDKEMKTAEKCWKTLNDPKHEATIELARNPLLLTLLCLVYDSTQNFPRNRVDLYEKALNIFLEEWLAEKRVSRDTSVSQYLDIADEKRMLSEIAAKNFEKDCLFFRKSELFNLIKKFGEGSANTPSTFNPRKILDMILVDQGLFVERVTNFYSFSHLTFQEYLTANYIIRDTKSIQGLVTHHLHDERWREVFLLTAGRMHEADILLLEMVNEASKSIETPLLKMLFQWAKRITNPTGSLIDRTTKQIFSIRQFHSLWLLNKTYEVIKQEINPSFGLNRAFKNGFFAEDFEDEGFWDEGFEDEFFWNEDFEDEDPEDEDPEDEDPENEDFMDSTNKLYQDFNLYLALNHYLDSDFYREYNLSLELYTGLKLDPDLYLNLLPDCYVDHPEINSYLNLFYDLDLCLYHRRHFNHLFYPLASSDFVNRFVAELSTRITLVRRIENANIFKGVDLRKLVQRFNEQREFIKALIEGDQVIPPKESIHDTWISVLGITDDMLAISRAEIENFFQYVRTVQLILACKEAAGRVSPEVWQKLEAQLLSWNVKENED